MIPKRIYSYWHDKSNLPHIVEKCLEELRKNHKGWEIIVYDANSLPSNLTFPNNYKNLSHQAKSDWIRLNLLRDGGIWLDASILVNIPLNKIFDMNFDGLQGYKTPFESNAVESWLLVVPKNSIFIEKWIQHFKEAIEMGFEEYKKTINPNWGIYSQLPYLTIHAACSKTRADLPDYPIKLFDSTKKPYGPFIIHKECDWNTTSLTWRIVKEAQNYPILKIRGCDRTGIEWFNILGMYTKETFFGKYPLLLPVILCAIILVFWLFFSGFDLKFF